MIDTKDCLCIFRRIWKNCLYGVNNAVQRSCHVSCKNKQYFGQHEVFFVWRADSCREYDGVLVFYYDDLIHAENITATLFLIFFSMSWFMQGIWQLPFFLWRADSCRGHDNHLVFFCDELIHGGNERATLLYVSFVGIRCTRQSGRRLKN